MKPSSSIAFARTGASGASSSIRSPGAAFEPMASSAPPAIARGTSLPASERTSRGTAASASSIPRERAAADRTSRTRSSRAAINGATDVSAPMSPSANAAVARLAERRERMQLELTLDGAALFEELRDPVPWLAAQLARIATEDRRQRARLLGGQPPELGLFPVDQLERDGPQLLLQRGAAALHASEPEPPPDEHEHGRQGEQRQRHPDQLEGSDQRTLERLARMACTRDRSSCGLNGLRR